MPFFEAVQFTLEPTLAGKGVLKIFCELLFPTTQDALFDPEVSGGLGHAVHFFRYQAHSLHPEFAGVNLSLFL